MHAGQAILLQNKSQQVLPWVSMAASIQASSAGCAVQIAERLQAKNKIIHIKYSLFKQKFQLLDVIFRAKANAYHYC